MIPEKEEILASLAQRHGAERQQKLNAATVAVCGLGGLGSNISICLARAGVGRLILTDFDRVDISNLNRQQYKADQIGRFKTEALADNLHEIMPYTELTTHTEKITDNNLAALLGEADIICEAFDVAENKAMLVNGVLEQLPDKLLVSGSGMAGFGPANSIATRRIGSRLILCGDGSSDVSDGIGLVASRVMICAAHQAHAVIRLITGDTETEN